MPRDGSSLPPSGSSSTAPIGIGEIANPPFAVVPDPAALFARRAARFTALARRDDGMGPYLTFLSRLHQAGVAILPALPAPRLPDARNLELAREHGMPPLGTVTADGDPAVAATLEALTAAFDRSGMPAGTVGALDRLAAASADDRLALLGAAFAGEVDADRIAEHVFAAAAVQVHMARLAALLDADSLQKITDGACPACGSPPVASSVVNWEGAANSRFCACSVCGTQWHVPRVRCLSCGGERAITFYGLGDDEEAVKAETCRTCRTYVKIVYEPRDRDVEPLADDVASLALDLLMRQEGFARAASNPFLVGY